MSAKRTSRWRATTRTWRAQWLLGVPAPRLDADGGAVHLADGPAVRADGLVLATGAAPGPARHRTARRSACTAHPSRRPGPAQRTPPWRTAYGDRRRIHWRRGRFHRDEIGLHVTDVEAALTPLAGPLGEQHGAAVARLHADHGVRLLCGAGVKGLTDNDRVDAVSWMTGVGPRRHRRWSASARCPCVEWLRVSPLELANGVMCGVDGPTSFRIVAVGDCAAWYDPHWAPHRVEHWTVARERPAVAVAALLAGGRHNAAGAGPVLLVRPVRLKIQFAGSPTPATRSPWRKAHSRRPLPGCLPARRSTRRRTRMDQPALHALAQATRRRPGPDLTALCHPPGGRPAEESR